jgi:hypothetical protein
MVSQDPHLSDQELLLAADGELPAGRAGQVNAHLAECWACRARKQEIESAIADFVHFQQRTLDPMLPPAAGPRALLKAQLSQLALDPEPRWPRSFLASWRLSLVSAAAVCILALLAVLAGPWRPMRRAVPVAVPKANVTPGAAILLSREQVCAATNENNRPVPGSLQRAVLEEYGIARTDARAYEVDYLITPALGGAEDIHNLWPQSYSLTAWNAHVKDALEDHLRGLVCTGRLDLATAQRDISTDWIAAYRKYFHTDKPLETAR